MPWVCWFPAEIERLGRVITGKCHRTLFPACCVTIAGVSPQRGLPGWCSRDRRAVVTRQIVAFRLSAKHTPPSVHASFARTDSALIGSPSWTRTPAPPSLVSMCVRGLQSAGCVPGCASPCGVSPCCCRDGDSNVPGGLRPRCPCVSRQALPGIDGRCRVLHLFFSTQLDKFPA